MLDSLLRLAFGVVRRSYVRWELRRRGLGIGMTVGEVSELLIRMSPPQSRVEWYRHNHGWRCAVVTRGYAAHWVDAPTGYQAARELLEMLA